MRIRILYLAASAFLAVSALAARADSYTFTISTGSTSTTPGTTFVVSGTLTGRQTFLTHPIPLSI